ncbi:MAG TPA: alpha-glucosidase family protein [Micavibrio sp.]
MSDNPWWRGGVFYQIYPRSFQDSGKKGTGDLRGIMTRLPYLADLGIDALWISPFFKSPNKDYGYDVSDYAAIDPQFGTMDDFRNLLASAHRFGIKIIIDLVMNHTSDQHQWFKESASNRTNPKADWYVWADPQPDGTPPNNWLSIFGGPAWHFNVLRGQYYLHNFLKEQPDLNYNNPEVVEAMLAQMRYWLDFGVDGFRFDVLNFYTHDQALRDNPPRTDGGMASQLEFPDAYAMQWHIYDKSRPENIALVRKIRALLNQYPHTTSLAEIGDDHPVKTAAAYTASDQELHMAYSFALMANKGTMPPARFFRNVIEDQKSQPGESWPAWAFSNHDVVRAASRWSGTDYGHDPRLSKLLMVLLLSLRGTPFIYQGDELGLPEADIAFDDICDPWGKYLYPKWKGRDGCRTPMPWRGLSLWHRHAGFSQAQKTWLPVSPSHLPLNVQAQNQDPDSVFQATRDFIKWRKARPAMVHGDIEFIETGSESVLAFRRRLHDQNIVCVFNLTDQPQKNGNQTLPPFAFHFIE